MLPPGAMTRREFAAKLREDIREARKLPRVVDEEEAEYDRALLEARRGTPYLPGWVIAVYSPNRSARVCRH